MSPFSTPSLRKRSSGGRGLGCATKRNLAQKILGEFYSGRGAHRLTRLGEEAFSRLHFVQPSSSPSRVKRSLPLTTKSSSEKSPNFLETAICRAPQARPQVLEPFGFFNVFLQSSRQLCRIVVAGESHFPQAEFHQIDFHAMAVIEPLVREPISPK